MLLQLGQWDLSLVLGTNVIDMKVGGKEGLVAHFRRSLCMISCLYLQHIHIVYVASVCLKLHW